MKEKQKERNFGATGILLFALFSDLDFLMFKKKGVSHGGVTMIYFSKLLQLSSKWARLKLESICAWADPMGVFMRQ